MPNAERVVVVGTAGHVDHGKSAIVLALTGTDPDRLSEEKARGLTIDLGFAWLELANGIVASLVDVPGHEDFIRNMLAGAGGIDAALLVVAADEGPMPQTREHLAILDLLGVRCGVVALTKIDLVEDEDWLALVETEVTDMLTGTSLAGAPICPVSAVTRSGLETLAGALADALAAVPPPVDRGRPRLAVDRAFTLAGFGTVVTGTLRDGSLSADDTLVLLPAGQALRVRGLQSHGRSVSTALPGRRTAVNLVGIDASSVARGSVLARPDDYRPTRLVDVTMELLPEAPATVRHGSEVLVFHGASDTPASVRLIGGRSIAPGARGGAQLRLARPLVVAARDRFVLRQPSPGATIGGGLVLDPRPSGRRRRFRPAVVARFDALDGGEAADVAWHMLSERQPCRAADLDPVDTGLEASERDAALAALAADGRARKLGRLWITTEGFAALRSRATSALRIYHRRFPLRAGPPLEELRERLHLSPEAFAAVLAGATDEGWLVRDGDNLRLPDHQVSFDADTQTAADALLARYRSAPYTPPSLSEAEASVGREVVAALAGRGDLVNVGGDVLFDRAAYETVRQAVLDHMALHGEITVAVLRDRFSTSRKYALALLEHFDRLRLTRRVGDVRVPGAAGGDGQEPAP